jgi:hypothetical protein
MKERYQERNTNNNKKRKFNAKININGFIFLTCQFALFAKNLIPSR